MTTDMAHHSYHAAPRSTKKRYQTTLHFEDMLKVDSERKKHLASRARQSRLQQHDSSLLTHEPAIWMAFSACVDDDVQPNLISDIDEAAIRNDSWLPYERPVPNRDDAYWRAELENINWDGTTLHGRDTPLEQTSSDAALRRPQPLQLDDPFVSPAKPHAIGQAMDQYTLHSPQRNRPKTKKVHHRGRSILAHHTFLENGQMYHPQLHGTRPESVPNYSRPLTPDCHPTPKRTVRAKPSTLKSRPSDQDISYERVNGIYLDTTPRSAKEHRDGLSIPEIEARDLVKLDEWLHEHISSVAEFTSLEPHPARPPPPIGGKENSVRAISPQPPSAGKNHTFVSRYSWTVDTGIDQDLSATPVIPLRRREMEGRDVNKSHQIEPARALLTEIIQGILEPTGDTPRPDDEMDSDENDPDQQLYVHQDYPPDYSTLQPHDRPGKREAVSHSSRYIVGPTGLDVRYSDDGSYRKRFESYGRSAIRIVSLRNSRACGRGTL